MQALVLANRMPSGEEYLLLGLVIFGSVFGLIAQLILAIFLLLKIRRGATQPSYLLPIIAICVSVVILFAGLAGLMLTSGLNLIWAPAGWALLMGCSLTCILWAVVVMTRPSWPAFSLHFVRWVPVLLLPLIPVGLLLPVWMKDAGVKGANKRARRYVDRTYLGHFLSTDDLVFSADGKRLFTVSKHDKAPWPSVWFLKSGERTRQPKETPPASPHLCFVKGGLVWLEGSHGSIYGRLVFRDTARPGSIPKALGIQSAVALACTPDGRTVVVGSALNEGMIRVYGFPAGRVIRQWSVSAEGRNVAVSHDGRFIAHDFSKGASIQIHRVGDGAVVRKISTSFKGVNLSSMGLSAKGDYLALGGTNRRLEVWARTGPGHGQPVLTEGPRRQHGDVQVLFTQSSKQLLATGGHDFVLARWTVGSWKVSKRLRRWPDANNGRCPSPRSLREMGGVDQDPVIVGCSGFADVVSVETGKRLQTLVGLNGGIDALSYTSQGGLIAASGSRQPPAVFSYKTGDRVEVGGPLRLTGSAKSLAQSSAAGLVAVGLNDGNLAVFRGSEAILQSIHFPSAGRRSGDIHTLAFSSDGRFVLSADTRGLLRLWSVAKRYPLATIATSSKDKTVAMVQLKDNAFLVLSESGDLRRWTIHGLGLKAGKRFKSGCDKGSSLTVSQKLDRMAVGCRGGATRLLSLSTRVAKGATARVHRYGVTALAFAPGGRYLLSGGGYGRVVVWSLSNLKGHREIFSPLRDNSGKVPYMQDINRIVFAPGGKKFAVITKTNHHNIHLLRSSCLGSK